MSRPDRLAILADIARVGAEYPDLGEEVVRALRGRLRWRQPHEPTLDEFRAYVERLSGLGADALRLELGLVAYPARHRPRPASPATAPGRGRPRGSGQLTAGSVGAAHQAFRAERGRRPTQAELASRLDVAVRSLQRFLRDHELGWPLKE